MTGPKLADLVRDTKLEVAVFADHAVHTCYVADPQMRRRRARVEERWERKGGKLLGRGGFGSVWLEHCAAGPAAGQKRAVKVIAKEVLAGGAADAAVGYARELEAIAKFSQERVRLPIQVKYKFAY
jgi:hypothetical protein